MLMNDEDYYRKSAYWYSRGRMDERVGRGEPPDWDHADRYVHYVIGITREVDAGERSCMPSLADAWGEYAALRHEASREAAR